MNTYMYTSCPSDQKKVLRRQTVADICFSVNLTFIALYHDNNYMYTTHVHPWYMNVLLRATLSQIA